MVVVSFPTNQLKKKLKLSGDFEKTLSETLFKIGMELESTNDNETIIDIAGAGNRIDAVSLEGLARIVNAYIGNYDFHFPKITKGKNIINVDKNVLLMRPHMGAFIVRGIDFNDDNLRRMINYQDKIHSTFGRNRLMLAMGLYRLSVVKFPLNFTALPAKEIRFAPLGFEEEMTGEEILKKHEKGKAFSHLVKSTSGHVPIFRDSTGKVLSMIPVINSNDAGKVEQGKQDILVEASGFNPNLLVQLLTSNALDFADMGGQIETCTVNYNGKKVEFPQFTFDKYALSISEIESKLGLSFSTQQAIKLLKQMMLPATAKGKSVLVDVPRFRSDVVHKVDVIEDIGRAYGFDNFAPLAPTQYNFGKKHSKTVLFDSIISSFVGLGFQQVVSLILTSKNEATAKANVVDNGKFVELHSSRALGLDSCRQSLLPGLLAIIASNKGYSYPQKIFEVGECLELDKNNETGASTTWKTSAIIAGANLGFADAKATIEALGRCLDDYKLKIEQIEDKRFITGRCAKVTGKTFNGIFGELDLQLLRNHGIEMPCTAIELELKQKK